MIPIRISPYFFLIAALIGWLSSGNLFLMLLWIGVVFISVLFHEFGHALAALFFGHNVEIHLTGYGGVTHRQGKRLSRLKEFIIVIAGPTFGALLAIAAYQLLPFIDKKNFPISHYVIEITAVANVFWTLINLLPTQPLDGGKLIALPLEALFGFTGLKASFLISLVISLLISFYFFAINAILAGAVFLILAFENLMSFKSTLSMTEEDQDQSLWEDLKVAQEKINKGEIDEAYTLFEGVANKSGKGVIHVAAIEALASILRFKGKFEESYHLFETVKENLSVDYLKMLQEVAFHTGHFQESLEAGSRVYRDMPDFQVALFNAKSHAKLGDIVPACGWIQSAQKEGAPHLLEVLNDKAFDSIRMAPEFQELIRLIEKRS